MEFEDICQELELVKVGCDDVICCRELEYVPEFNAMRKQLGKGERLAAYFIFQDMLEDVAVEVNTADQFDIISGLLERNMEAVKLYEQNPELRDDVVFREISFFAI